MASIGEKIKAKRKKERLSAQDLAVKLSLKKENIYKWERGSTPSDPEEYKKIILWLENVPREEDHEGIEEQDGDSEKTYQGKYQRLLERQLDLYNNTLIANLTQLLSGVQQNQVLLKTGLKQMASMDSRVRKVKIDTVMQEINKMTAEYAGLSQENDNAAGKSYNKQEA